MLLYTISQTRPMQEIIPPKTLSLNYITITAKFKNKARPAYFKGRPQGFFLIIIIF
jgi:hypothetical protein